MQIPVRLQDVIHLRSGLFSGSSGGMINLPLIFDLALHDGYSPMLKKKLGISTGDARKFDSFEEVYSAFKKQFSYLVPYMHLYKNMDKLMFAQYSPCLLQVCVDAGLY